ncbi:MAG: hypothetical protein JNG84_01020 [Archangium sp.]|nr:hypothetical protein [Archangium sp.]
MTCAALVLPVVAAASTVMALSLEELTHRSALVVHGVVQRAQPLKTDSGQIWTYAEVSVREVLKGRTDSATVVVKQPGGVVGPIGQSVAGAATFIPDEEVVLFLEPATDERDAFVTLGLALGKVTLELRNGQRVANRHLDGLNLMQRGDGSPRPVDSFEKLGNADAVLAKIRRSAEVQR